MEKEHFFELMDKHLSGESTLEEDKLLLRYYESFQKPMEWEESIGPKEVLKRKMLLRLQNALDSEEVNTISIKSSYSKTIFKFAVAASVLISISLIVYKTNKKKENTQTVVNNTIEVGTDKAVLTLENGSQVALEKGAIYQTQHADSNGKQIVYKTKKGTSAEIAYNYLTIPRGGQFHIKLSDGTQVWLNSESQLKYPIVFNDGETRQVELVYGEAYFQVSPSTSHNGSKFKVFNQFQEIEVLGTEFNIRAYKDETNVYTTLVEGSVTVNNMNTNHNLAPNQQSNLDIQNNGITISTIDVKSEISWRNGVFSFRDKTLKEIMKILSRWYNTDIIFLNKELENINFKGVLSKNQNIEEILMLIKNINAINNYEIDDGVITIK